MTDVMLRFDLFRDAVFPGAGPTGPHTAPWRAKLASADGMAWSGLFDQAGGDVGLQSLAFDDGTTRGKSPAAVRLDWDATGQDLLVRSELAWNVIKNILLDQFTGSRLTVENLVDVVIDLRASTAGQEVIIDGAKRGRIDLGSGDDTLWIGVDSNESRWSNTFVINSGAGNDQVTVARSTVDYSATGGFTAAYRESWTSTVVDLGDGDDVFVGMGSSDDVMGGAGNDTAGLGGGNDRFDGGDGIDTVALRGRRDDYAIEDLGNGRFRLTDLRPGVDGDDGVALLTAVELAQFTDQTVTLLGAPDLLPDALDDAATTAEDMAVVIAVLANDAPGDGPGVTTIAAGPANGIAVVNADGSITYTPAGNFNGTDSFTYRLTDADGDGDTATVTVTVSAVNDAPVANADTAAVDEGASVTIDVAANDTDIDGDPLAVASIAVGPTFGTVAIVNGQLVYTANDGVGAVLDSFSYVIADGQGGTATGQVSVGIGDVNTPPVAIDDAASTDEDTAISVVVLANDADDDAAPPVVTIVGGPANGAAVVNADGSITYTPGAHFSGTDAITYRITDSAGQTADATVAITIAAADDAPVARDDVFFTFEDAAFQGDVSVNDSEYDNDPRTYALVGESPAGLVFNADGTFTYAPPADFSGVVSFAYSLADGAGGSDTAEVLITVLPVNDLPVGGDDAAATAFATAIVIDVLANDSDAEAGALSVGGVTGPANGVLSNVGATITYTPNAGFSGVDTFTYRPFDGTDQGNVTTVTVTVAASTNVPPVAVDDALSVPIDGELAVAIADLLANDSDPNGDAFIYTSASNPVNGALGEAGGVLFFAPTPGFVGVASFDYTIQDALGATDTATVFVSVLPPPGPVATNDTFTVAEDSAGNLLGALGNDAFGTGISNVIGPGPAHGVASVTFGGFLYTPDVDFSGTDSFSYTLVDAYGQSSTATVSITITPVNDAPVLLDPGTFVGVEDAPLGGQVNAFDADGDALSFTSGTGLAGLVLAADGSFAYTPAPDFTGIVSFDVTVSDGQGGLVAGTIFLQLNPVNDAPVGVADAAATAFGTAVAIAVLANDSDADGDALLPLLDAQAANGTAVVNADGTFTYTPDAGFSGVDSFTYRPFDGAVQGNVATVTVTVAALGNTAPVASDFAISIAEDSPSQLFSLAALTADAETNVTGYAISNVVGGSITGFDPASGLGVFAPTANFNGAAGFTFTATDAGGLSDSASYAITLTPEDDGPAPQADGNPAAPFAMGTEDTVLVIDVAALLTNDTHPDGAAALAGTTFSIASSAPGIDAVAVVGGQVLVTPVAGFSGATTFAYRLVDGDGDVASANVFLDFTPVNDAPVATDDSFARAATPTQTFTAAQLVANDVDPDNQNSNPADDQVLAITAVEAITGAAVALNADQSVTVTFTGGPVQFQYTLSDGVVSDTATVTLNTPPVAVDDAVTIDEDVSWTAYHFVDVLANDTDGEGDPLGIASVTTAGTPIIADVVGGQVRFYVNDPTNDTSGVFVIIYSVTDGLGFDTGAITITVTPRNDAPRDPQGSDAALGLTTAEDAPLVISIAALLADETQPADEAQTVLLASVQGAFGGTVANNGNGTLTFTPAANFNGTAGFYYTAEDEQGLDGFPVYVPISVTPVNDPMTAADDFVAREFQGGGVQTITRAQLLGNDTDVDGDAAITAVAIIGGISALVLNADQSVTFTYTTGSQPVFAYTLSDGTFSDSASVTVNTGPQVTGTPGTLVLDEDSQTYLFDDVLIALAGVTDPEDDNLFIRSYETSPTIDVLDWFFEAAYYTPGPQDFNGATTLTFTISDGNQAADLTVTLNVTVAPVNDGPRDPGGEDTGPTIVEGAAFVDLSKAALIADDVDPEGDGVAFGTYNLSVFGINEAGQNVYAGFLSDQGGDVLRFFPQENFAGVATAIYYAIDQANPAAQGPGIDVRITVTGVEDPIVAADDTLLRTAGTTQVIALSNILGNDFDPDSADTKIIVDLVADNGIGNVFLDGLGNVVVEYAAGSTGRAAFTYRVQDGAGNSDTATVTLNRAPVAVVDGTFTIDEGDDYTFIPLNAMLGNDSDADGDALTFVFGGGASNVTLLSNGFTGFIFTEGGVQGLRIAANPDEYVGPGEFLYYVFDGTNFSDLATVTLNVVAGDDVPEANDDNWFYTGATYGDLNPATNPLVGVEDGADLVIPFSLLIDGGPLDGFGADEDDAANDSLTIVGGSSAFGTVSIVGDTLVFNPYDNVNSDVSGTIIVTYTVQDPAGQTDDGLIYVNILATDDPVVAGDDAYAITGSSFAIDFADQFGAFDIRGNDSAPDNFSGVPEIVDMAAISGTSSFLWNGVTAFITGDGSSEVVLEYTVQDANGDTATAQIVLTVEPPSAQVFYFSGSVPDYGRELWVYDPETYDETLGGPFATMVDAAETHQGPGSGDPREITALADSVFWRGDLFIDFGGEGSSSDYTWNVHAPGQGWQALSSVNTESFDANLDYLDQNLGVRAGDLFWGATFGEGDALTAWDRTGVTIASVEIGGFNRELLTDAGGDPAFAAVTFTIDPGTGDGFEAEQLHVVLPVGGFGGWASYQATAGGTEANDIYEIAGLSIQPSGSTETETLGKILYFVGHFTTPAGELREYALWKVTLEGDQFGWTGEVQPEFIDNGSGGEVYTDPYALTVVAMLVDTDLDVGTDPVLAERLFHFGTDAGGDRQIATRFDSYTAGTSGSTESAYFGNPFEGIEIRPWEDGVVFTGYVPGIDTLFLANWTDADGDGVFLLDAMVEFFGGTLEQLTVDGAGFVAVVQDEGETDTLFLATAAGLQYQVSYAGEITDVQLAGGHLVYVADGSDFQRTLFDLDLATFTSIEVPTDEFTGGGLGGDGYVSSYRNVRVSDSGNVNGGIAFDADLGFGNGFRLFVTNGVDIAAPAGGFQVTSEGAQFQGDWIGTGYRFDTAELGLFRIDHLGNTTTLVTDSTNFSSEAEVLGQQVVFGTTSAVANQIFAYDIGADTLTTLLFDHLLGAAAVVGGAVVFDALDLNKAENSDVDPTNNVWTLYRYDGVDLDTLLDLPTGAGGGQHVYEWWRHQDFLGDDSRIFWKQANDDTGVEVHTIDLTDPDPASTLAIIDLNPGAGDGANGPDAVFANGRLFFQGAPDGTFNTQTLYTTTDGTDAQLVTGATAADAFSGAYLPVTIGDEVFFLARKDGLGTADFGIFQVNDDGVTASLITPADFAAYGLAAVESQLYFFAFEPVSNTAQMFSLTPGETPVEATPTQLTSFAGINGAGNEGDIFLGGGGNIFFSRREPDTGRELWVLDAAQEAGARLVADINTETGGSGGYAPEQVVATPDPLLDGSAGGGIFP
jgi:ELWxxDGT repeat protein